MKMAPPFTWHWRFLQSSFVGLHIPSRSVGICPEVSLFAKMLSLAGNICVFFLLSTSVFSYVTSVFGIVKTNFEFSRKASNSLRNHSIWKMVTEFVSTIRFAVEFLPKCPSNYVCGNMIRNRKSALDYCACYRRSLAIDAEQRNENASKPSSAPQIVVNLPPKIEWKTPVSDLHVKISHSIPDKCLPQWLGIIDTGYCHLANVRAFPAKQKRSCFVQCKSSMFSRVLLYVTMQAVRSMDSSLKLPWWTTKQINGCEGHATGCFVSDNKHLQVVHL